MRINKIAKILVIITFLLLIGLLPIKTNNKFTKPYYTKSKIIPKPLIYKPNNKNPSTRIARTMENGVDLVYPILIYSDEPDIQSVEISPPQELKFVPLSNSTSIIINQK